MSLTTSLWASIVGASLWGDMHTETDPEVVIVGGGIAGSAMAVQLARHGRRAGRLDHAALVPGVEGALCMHHPVACETLNRLAAEAGATVVRGVDEVHIHGGPTPAVSYRVDQRQVSHAPRLVVGADGRTSTVREQAGITLHRGAQDVLVTGVLVEGATDWPQDTYALGTEGDRMYFVFPQGGDRLRLYMCITPEQRDRFAGPTGAERGGEDTWTDPPFSEGVVLIGDAAGYNNPIIGQGLSLALRDVDLVSQLLLDSGDWSMETLRPYATERDERMRRVRFSAQMFVDLYCAFGPDGARRRGAFFGRRASGEDPTLEWALAPPLIGPDQLPPEAYDEAFRRKVLEPAAAGA